MATKETPRDIESLLKEGRTFPPPAEFTAKAHIKSQAEVDALRKKAQEDPDTFWSEIANELHWFKKWDKVLDWQIPHAKWFVGGKTNIAYNCLDRHLETRANKTAILFEGEPGDRRSYTFRELHTEVCKFANALQELGVTTGDRVAIYMPMVPEAAIAMLACARIGAIHSVVFGGFSAEALRGRVVDAECKVVITADGGWRRGSVVPLKGNVDDAIKDAACVDHVVVVKRCENDVTMKEGRDLWWHDVMEKASPEHQAVELDAEHPLYILYTSGTTGKPKGILHTTGGYMVNTYITSKWVFDLKEEDVFWCTADIGWVTGHSYVVYGILANGATTLMYEGAPNQPDPGRFWEIVDNYKVSVFYTAPTAIRAFMKWGDEWPAKHSLSSLRLLGSVGEPINPEAWMWYHQAIGKEKCPIVDTWWQTETGSILITPLPGVTATKPGSACSTLPWIDADVVNKDGKSVPQNSGGFLVLRKPWPSMLRTIYKDDDRYKKQYWTEIPGMYFAGDSSKIDNDGYYWVMGRVDDVLNVSGHRIGTMEVESALVSHPAVTEAAVVGMPDAIKGQAIAAFVTLGGGQTASDELKDALRKHVTKEIGAIAKPGLIRFADALPKTRSGKIMRRLLKAIAAGEDISGDTTTLEDPRVLKQLRGE